MSSFAEISLSTPHTFLAELAPMVAGGWRALGAQIYPGELSIATDNGVYRFKNGIFQSRAKNAARSFDCPKAMRGLRLIGFLFDEGGMCLSPHWQPGAPAVLWKEGETDAQSFVLTSPTKDFTLEEPDPKPLEPGPKPIPWAAARAPSESGFMLRRTARPPSIRRPMPPSMTRIHLGHGLSH